MTPKIIEAAGKQWIAGMRWRYDARRLTMRDIRAEGKAIKLPPHANEENRTGKPADWYALRASAKSTQTGYCRLVPGQAARPRKLYSLAAAIADIKMQPWVGKYELGPDLWWCIAVRERQAILPDGDLIGTEDEINEAYNELLAQDNWNTVTGTLNDLLPILKNRKALPSLSQVRSLTPISPYKTFGPPAIAICLVGAGVWGWNKHEQDVEAARLAALELSKQQVHEQSPPSPLISTPNPDTWLDACKNKLQNLPLSSNGWLLSAISCDQGQASIVWSRGANATVAAKPAGPLSNDGNSVSMSLPLGRLPVGAGNSKGLEAGVLALFALLQPLAVQVEVSAPPQPVGLPGAAPPAAENAVPTDMVHFTLPIAPWEVPFSQIPGLRLYSIQRNQDGTWNVTGALYGR